MKLNETNIPDENLPITLDRVTERLIWKYLQAVPDNLYIGERWMPVYAQILCDVEKMNALPYVLSTSGGALSYMNGIKEHLSSTMFGWTKFLEYYVHKLCDGVEASSIAVHVEEETDPNALNYKIRDTEDGRAITVIVARPWRVRLTLLRDKKRRFRITSNAVVTFHTGHPYTAKARVLTSFIYEGDAAPALNDYREQRHAEIVKEGKLIADEHLNGAQFSYEMACTDDIVEIYENTVVTDDEEALSK